VKKLLYLEDLYNFYVSQNKNVKFSSKDSDTTIVVHIDEPITFGKEDTDDLNMICPIRLCHTEDNVNKSTISEKSMKDAIPSAYNMPILGYVYKDDNDIYQFAGHEFFLNEENEIEYEEQPVGCIPESAGLQLVYDKDMDKTYLEGNGIIWRTYSKAADIIEREQKLWCSVELVVDELSFDSKNKLLVIDKFRFSGVTILGKDRETGNDIQPGMTGSNISIADFSEKNNSVFSNNDKVIELLSALNEKIDNLNINQKISKEGGNPVKKEFEEITEEEIKDSPSTEVFDDNDGDGGTDYYDDPPSDDGDGNSTDPVEEVVTDPEGGNDNPTQGETGYTSSDNGDNDNPSGGNTPVNPQTGYGTDDDDDDDDDDGDGDGDGDNDEGELTIPLGQRDDDDTAGGSKKIDNALDVTVSYGETSKQFSVSLQDKIGALYTLVNDTYSDVDGTWYDVEVYDEDKYIIMNSWSGKAYKQSYKVKKNIYSLVGDRTPVKAIWCTEDEEKALDNMRANYSSIVEELSKYEAEPDKLEVLTDECYSQIADTDAFKKLCEKETYFNMSVDEVRNKADEILLEFAKGNKISFSAENKKSVSTKKFGNPSKKAVKGKYGGIFKK